MWKNILNGIAAGVLISIGGTVFLACENRYVGAVLFTVALLCICIMGYALYTGKVCYMIEKHDKDAFSLLLLCLLGNLVGTYAIGTLLRFAIPTLQQTAEALCRGKLEGQALWQTLVRGIMCGILIYLAVVIYRDKKTIAGIVFCIPVFILCGFEHSIADMYYFAVSGIVSFDALIFIWMVVLGNSIGGLLLPFIQWLAGKATRPKEVKEPSESEAEKTE